MDFVYNEQIIKNSKRQFFKELTQRIKDHITKKEIIQSKLDGLYKLSEENPYSDINISDENLSKISNDAAEEEMLVKKLSINNKRKDIISSYIFRLIHESLFLGSLKIRDILFVINTTGVLNNSNERIYASYLLGANTSFSKCFNIY